jgi:GNAT superfamily N-acetyltransferase
MADAALGSGMPELAYLSLEDEGQRVEYAERCLALSTAVGWSHYDLPKWLSLLHGCDELFLAQREDCSIVGCLLRVAYPVAAAGASDVSAFSMFGMMLVDPARRGQGVAKRLIGNYERRASDLGHACGLGVATPDGFPVYSKRGYRAAIADSICCKLTASAAVAAALPCEGFEVEVQAEDLETVAALDQVASGLVRTRQLECLWNAAEGSQRCVAVARAGGEAVGALMATADSQSGAMILGPVLGSEAAGRALIASVARTLPEDASLAILVLDHSAFVEELKSQGFNASGNPMVGTMLLGDAKIPGDRSRYIGMMHGYFG